MRYSIILFGVCRVVRVEALHQPDVRWLLYFRVDPALALKDYPFQTTTLSFKFIFNIIQNILHRRKSTFVWLFDFLFVIRFFRCFGQCNFTQGRGGGQTAHHKTEYWTILPRMKKSRLQPHFYHFSFFFCHWKKKDENTCWNRRRRAFRVTKKTRLNVCLFGFRSFFQPFFAVVASSGSHISPQKDYRRKRPCWVAGANFKVFLEVKTRATNPTQSIVEDRWLDGDDIVYFLVLWLPLLDGNDSLFVCRKMYGENQLSRTKLLLLHIQQGMLTDCNKLDREIDVNLIWSNRMCCCRIAKIELF